MREKTDINGDFSAAALFDKKFARPYARMKKNRRYGRAREWREYQKM
mgnify:CR=1 FL=1